MLEAYLEKSVSRPGIKRGLPEDDASNAQPNSKFRKKPVACKSCRKKKIKCSADRPACSNCLRQNVECEYPRIRNRGSRFGYWETVKKRLSSLEKYVGDGIAQYEMPSQGPDPECSLSTVELLDSIKPPRASHTTASDATSAVTSAAATNSIPLPPLQIRKHLAELYFKHVNSQTYAFLHKPTFMARLERGEVNPALVFALCGLCARFSNHPEIVNSSHDERYSFGEQYRHQARKIISNQVFRDSIGIETLQAMVCLIQHDFFGEKGSKAMMYISLATRAARNMFLHSEAHYQDKETWLDGEIRRRTFWSLVVLDRLAHGSPSWPVQFLQSNYNSTPLPASNRAFLECIPTKTITMEEIRAGGCSPPTIGLFTFHILAVMLWCDINRYAASSQTRNDDGQFDILRARLGRLQSVLPEKYRYSRKRLYELRVYNMQGQYIHLHAEILAAKCVLHRSHGDLETASEAADALTDIVNDIQHSDEEITVAPFVGHAVLTVSAVHITNSSSPDPTVAARANKGLATNLRFLVELRAYWYTVGVWCNLLKERYTNLHGASSEVDEEPPLPYLPDGVIQKEKGALQEPSPAQSTNSPHATDIKSRSTVSNTVEQGLPEPVNPPQQPQTPVDIPHQSRLPASPEPDFTIAKFPWESATSTPKPDTRSFEDLLLAEIPAIDQFTAEWFSGLGGND
uniref:ARAD1D44990p n=1 Tax=Blastobotrys adeninivorans TaxID=409370 RepID=A0A060TJ81_BLAAD